MYNRFIKKDGEVLLDLTDDSISASDLLEGVTAHDKSGEKVTGTMPITTQATPSITINSSGLITASATQTAGYVAAGTKSGTKQLTTQAAKTITPSKSSQTAVASGRYTTGAVTVAAIPSNYIIPSGTKTITANGTHDVKNYASATVNVAGEDVTAETNAYTNKLATLETAITQLETELQGKASGGSGGASIETCTVVINHPYTANYDYISAHMATTYCNGEYSYDVSYKLYENIHTTQYIINNVVCGTYVYIESNIDSLMWGYSFENAELIAREVGFFLIKITARTGETAVINIWDNN